MIEIERLRSNPLLSLPRNVIAVNVPKGPSTFRSLILSVLKNVCEIPYEY